MLLSSLLSMDKAFTSSLSALLTANPSSSQSLYKTLHASGDVEGEKRGKNDVDTPAAAVHSTLTGGEFEIN